MAFVNDNEPGVAVAIIGATGAVGKDLAEVLVNSDFPLRELILVTSRRSANEVVQVDERKFRLFELPEEPVEDPLLEDVDLVFFATPAEVTKSVAPFFADAGVAVIDIGGTLAGNLPLSVAGIQENDDVFSEHRVACTPSAPALISARIFQPLQELGAMVMRSQILLSAGCVGKAGIDELSQQVSALYSYRDPPRTIFPSGLAFDMISTFGGNQEGWSTAEQRISLECANMLSAKPAQFALSLQVIPIFSGIVVAGHVAMAGEVDLIQVKDALAEASGLVVSDPPPGPRRLVGRKDIYIGRLRMDPVGDGFHFWAAADNIRAGAVDNAIQLAHYYWKEGLL